MKIDKNTAIKVSGVYKDFLIPHQQQDSLKGRFLHIFDSNSSATKRTTLKDINLEIKKGEFFGIVGRNGSGKSTLLKIIAEIYQPSKGSVKINGRLVPFIELGVGFNPKLTGRENVYLNGAILGFSKKQIDANYQKIVDFAELEEFMDMELKNYSSGMQVRLAFAAATMAKADIMLVDEVLAVGDASFQRKCFEYFREMKANKQTVIFVSHSMDQVREFCDRAALIDKSEIVDISDANSIAQKYSQLFASPTDLRRKSGVRWGDGGVAIESVTTAKKLFSEDDEYIDFTVKIRSDQDVSEDVRVGVLVKNHANQNITGTNSEKLGQSLTFDRKDQTISVHWKVRNIFKSGTYSITIAVESYSGKTYDWWNDSTQFETTTEYSVPYIVQPTMKVNIEKSK